MAKLPDTFEDWTPPWDEGSFDADKAARRIFNTEKKLEKAKQREADLEAEKDDLETRLSTAESKASGKDDSAKDQEIAALKKERDNLAKNGRPEDQRLIERLQVANDFGLTAKDAERLVGKDREELEADAEELAGRLGIERGNDGEREHSRERQEEPPQRGVRRTGEVGNGRDRGKPVDRVFSPDELLTQTGQTEAGLHLAPLGR